MNKFIFTGILTVFMILGVISFIKPEVVGIDLYFFKTKKGYVPYWRRSKNKQYHKQIKVVGIGLFFASLISLVYYNI